MKNGFAILFGLLCVSATALGQGVWQPLGPWGIKIRSVACDPLASTTLYVGTDGAGVFRSSDGGAHWAPASTGLPAGSTVKVLVIDPATTTTLYAATDGSGVFKSPDSGNTWFAANNGLDPNSDVTALAIDPANPAILYAAGTDFSGVFKTTDRGANWFAANTGLPEDDIPVLLVDPLQTETVYAGFDSEGIFKSTDGGATWAVAGTGLSLDIVQALAINPKDPSILYAGGLNFDPGTGEVDGGGVFKSTNGGTSWSAVGLSDFAIHALAVNPQVPSTLHVGTAGQGIFVSHDGGDHWSATNLGLINLDIKAMAADSRRMVYAGSRGDGLFKVSSPPSYHAFVVDGTMGTSTAQTFYTLANAGVTDEVVTVELFNDAGAPLALSNANPLPNCGMWCFAIKLGPGDSFMGRTGGMGTSGPIVFGYARVTASPAVRVSISNDYAGGQCSLPMAGFNTNATIPVTPAVPSGLFALNPSAGSATLNLSLLDESQTVAASSISLLPPLGRLAKFVSEFSWDKPVDFGTFSGSADVESSLPAAVVPITMPPLGGCPRAVPQGITASVSNGNLTVVQATGNPSPMDTPSGVDFPVGFLSFTIENLLTTGFATEVTVGLPPGVTVTTYYKYGPTPDNASPHWYEFLFDGTTGAEIFPDQIVLHLVDGGRGDRDLTANGIIEDPGAPAFRETNVPGDFDSDADPDLVWRNYSSGQNALWLMNGTLLANIVDLPALPDTGYRIEAIADFNYDSIPDIVWRNYPSGQNAIWIMNGTSVDSIADLPALPVPDYHIQAAGDFNGDGHSDIIWRNQSTGQNALWIMNGASILSIVDLPALPNADYLIAATGDFDQDGYTDIVWRNHATGQNALWLMTGTVLDTIVDLPALPNLNYVIEAAADFDNNKKPDLVWRNYSTGQNAVWLMNGTSLKTIVDLPALPNLDYEIGGPR